MVSLSWIVTKPSKRRLERLFPPEIEDYALPRAWLDAMLDAVATPPRPRRKTRPSRGAVERRLDDKHARAAKKQLRRDLGD